MSKSGERYKTKKGKMMHEKMEGKKVEKMEKKGMFPKIGKKK